MLEAQLAQGEDVKVAIDPSMADHYRERVANLREALAQEDCQAEAAAIMRTLIDKIVLTPVCQDGKDTLSITLHGHLAGILGLAAQAKGPLDASDPVVECTKLVAGTLGAPDVRAARARTSSTDDQSCQSRGIRPSRRRASHPDPSGRHFPSSRVGSMPLAGIGSLCGHRRQAASSAAPAIRPNTAKVHRRPIVAPSHPAKG